MHNTPLDNAKFRVTFTETNLRYINNCIGDASGEELPRLLELKTQILRDLEEAKKALARLRKE